MNEPLTPPPSYPTAAEEGRIHYRDNETGETYTSLCPSWMLQENANKLIRMGYDVLTQRRQVVTTVWETVTEHYAQEDEVAA
jgi:hypothetical protein